MLPPASRPIYFEQLTIENVRSFSEPQQLTLLDEHDRPARWTLVVGDNGVGKTTLLQCLARMAPVFNDPADDDTGSRSRAVEPELAREENSVLRALARNRATEPTRLSARLSVGARLKGLKHGSRDTIATSLDFTQTRNGIANFKAGGESHKRVQEPLVVGYSASRRPRAATLDSFITENPLASLLEIETELCDAEELLCRLDYSSLKGQDRATRFLANLKAALSEILPYVGGPDDIQILGPRSSIHDSERTGVHVRTPSGRVPLHQLSLGYRTVFAWTVDLAWRLLERYPRSSKPLHQPAIVLVDEVDLHLHPLWQREVRDHLAKQFPQVQFIATAHSPLMAQSSLGANLAIVRWENDHAVVEDDPVVVESWRLDQLVTSDLFELESARPPEIEKRQRRRAKLIEKAKLSAAERQELDTLNRTTLELQTESTDDERVIQLIRDAAARLPSAEGGS